MSYNFSVNLADRSNYGDRRSTGDIKFIVIHYTGNDGDFASSNARYFNTGGRGASAHYFVDDTDVIQSVPDDYNAWHVGDDVYYNACRNRNSLGVEMCDTQRNGVYNLSSATRANTVKLVRALMAKYGVPISNIVRHYDVTRKKCPAYFVENERAWEEFKAEIQNGMEDIIMTIKEITDISGTGARCSSWAKEATAFCAKKGIFTGDGSGNFGWEKPITREALAVVLVGVLTKLGVKDRI